MNEKTRLLPFIELDGVEYIVDVEHRKLIELETPDRIIDMHSEKGRRLVLTMQGLEWNSHIAVAESEQPLEV